MGAYAVEYITASHTPQRGYYEIDLIISYRRTVEQMKAVVTATSTEAVYRLLENALEEGKTEQVVRVGYWDGNSRTAVETAMAELRSQRGIEAESYWAAAYYPEEGAVGLVEFQLDAPAPENVEPVESENGEEGPAEEVTEGAQDQAVPEQTEKPT